MDNFEPIKERTKPDEIAERLEVMKSEIFFPDLKPAKNISDIINILSNIESLRKLAPQDLAEYSVVLACYSMFLTTQENRISSYINWCESNLKYIVGKNLSQLTGYFEEKNLTIRSSEEHCVQLDKIKLEAQVKLDSIKFTSQRIEFLVQTLKSLMWEKKREMNG